jgi:hypothetical protein
MGSLKDSLPCSGEGDERQGFFTCDRLAIQGIEPGPRDSY